MAQTLTQLGAYVLGLAAIVGATVAVSLGKIDAPTYVSIVVAFGGVGVGAGVHAAGTAVPTANSSPKSQPPP
ncbi:MAG: hypothetical protein E6J20_18515 [Chloroflexi bacterium]|nr:MAG: hypothetical protein E6J20_18515 [Chloroflexota bacterium]